MIPEAALTVTDHEHATANTTPRRLRAAVLPVPFTLSSHYAEIEPGHPQAELFYLQKQIQSQTPMVVVLTDGEHVEGCIEWYDRKAIKVRGRARTLVYKSSIKYMYKLSESGQ
ncbi:MAG TPA: hypothetical protein VMV57_14855 [Terracidiphilus sp.]|nr:hypothetical protein [Terracidiphilus sp.]